MLGDEYIVNYFAFLGVCLTHFSAAVQLVALVVQWILIILLFNV